MSVNFEKNAYLSAVKEKPYFNSESKIFNHTRTTGLQFKYADVKVKEFNQKYSPKGWFGRKVIALPAIIWSGVVKTIYHLAKAIIIGFLKALSDDGKYFQSQLFYIGRDFQESFGWLISLFNDRYGQYNIQESGFHKICYDYCLANERHSNLPPQASSFSNPATIAPLRTNPVNYETPIQSDTSSRDLNKEFKEIRSLSNTKEKEKLFAQLADIYFNKGDREKALKTIKEICHDSKTKEAFIAKIAISYYNEGNLDAALKIIKKICHDSKTKESVIAKIAEAYFKDDREKALKTIKEICHDSKTKEAFIAKIAISYCNEGNLDSALKIIKEICHDSKTKESVIVKIAEAYFKDDREKALKTIKEICHDSKTKESFIAKIAISYYNEGSLDIALKIIKEICHDSKTKESLIAEIANSYFTKGNRDLALKTILELCHNNTNVKLTFLVKLAQSYYSDADENGVLKAINEILKDSLSKKIIERRSHEIYIEIMNENIFTNIVKDFFADLAQTCYEQTKKHFASDSSQMILQAIIEKANDQSTINDFLKLKKK